MYVKLWIVIRSLTPCFRVQFIVSSGIPWGQLFAASYACCIPSKWVALHWFWPRYWPQMFATVLFSALFVATCCYFGAIFVSHGFEGTWFGFALHAAKCIQALACAKDCAFRHQWLPQCPCDFEDALTRFCHFPQILLAMLPSTKTIWGKRTKITKPTSLTNTTERWLQRSTGEAHGP